MPPPFSLQTDAKQQKTAPFIHLEFVAHLSRLHLPSKQEDLLAIRALVKPQTLQFRINEEPQEQMIKLLPNSLKQFPLYATIDAHQSVNRYWMRKEETISHGILRRLLTLFQICLPIDIPLVYRFTESDVFGRYVARYEIEKSSAQVQGSKCRERYVGGPYLSAQQIRVFPKGELNFRWQEGKGLVLLSGGSTNLWRDAFRAIV